MVYFRSSRASLVGDTGDATDVTYELGAAKPVEDTEFGPEAACIEDPERTIAVPFRITFEVTSSLPTRVGRSSTCRRSRR